MARPMPMKLFLARAMPATQQASRWALALGQFGIVNRPGPNGLRLAKRCAHHACIKSKDQPLGASPRLAPHQPDASAFRLIQLAAAAILVSSISLIAAGASAAEHPIA